MRFTSDHVFPGGLNLDGTGEFMLDLFLHETTRIRIPLSPLSALVGSLNGPALLALLKEDANCDVAGIERILERRRNILDGKVSISTNTTFPLPGVGDTTTPTLLLRTEPKYPSRAGIASAEGTVILKALIAKDGSVGEMEILHSTEPRVGFEEASMDAIRQWRYRPARQNGIPVDVYYTIKVDFKVP